MHAGNGSVRSTQCRSRVDTRLQQVLQSQSPKVTQLVTLTRLDVRGTAAMTDLKSHPLAQRPSANDDSSPAFSLPGKLTTHPASVRVLSLAPKPPMMTSVPALKYSRFSPRFSIRSGLPASTFQSSASPLAPFTFK